MSNHRTALVLGGGGITGIAWEIGLLAGLADAGIDLTGADLVVGTSAGSVVGAQVTSGAELPAMYERQLEPPTGEKVARMTRSLLAQYGWALKRRRVPAPRRDARARRREGRPHAVGAGAARRHRFAAGQHGVARPAADPHRRRC
jgi:NTE family protein